MSKSMLVAILVFFSFVVSADVPQDAVSVVYKKESFDPNVTVSGQVRAGVMYKNASDGRIALPLEYIYIDLGPKENEENAEICGNVISADGNYEASFSTDKLDQKHGKVPIKFIDSKYKDLGEYLYEEVTILAYEGSNNCKRIERIFPASWTESEKKKLAVYLNAGQFTTKLLLPPKVKGRSSSSVPCSKIKGDRQVAYDTVCEFELDAHSEFKLMDTKIRRSNGVNFAKPIRLPINYVSEIQ